MRALLSRITLALILAVYTAGAGAQDVAVNDGGDWRTLTEIHVNDGGVWREIQEVWVNDGGTWRMVFSAATVSLGADKVLFTDGSAGLANLSNTGNWTSSCAVSCVSGTWSSTWITPTSAAGADYDVRCTVNTGTMVGGGDACDGSTWHSLGTSRSFSAVAATFTLDIRATSTGMIRDSVQVTVASI